MIDLQIILLSVDNHLLPSLQTEIGSQNLTLKNFLNKFFESYVTMEPVPKSYLAIADQICASQKNAINMATFLAAIREAHHIDFDIQDQEEVEDGLKLVLTLMRIILELLQ